ncbi:MAG TPA: metal-sulfur cluster assembly factor [Puia sp.]|jgi:metal-sulfur cluster biosynthetic enzyme|nr:metal-sulfur cluster assembly factor [Puia sp.]
MNVITNDPVSCEKALEPLYEVYDPEIGLNVVDLGLIYQIDFLDDGKGIEATMTLTTQFCPMGESITDNVTRALNDTFADFRVNVNLVFDPPWNASRISERGREFLNRR